ncbi:hypothetical protein PG997_012208 [Apiospora hydei]|uniref:Rhodopsin domain-containing protein n=1 Tax=Apiospora hydei TaxID=1337664 RepID=A0ABR1V2P8_9PEZI
MNASTPEAEYLDQSRATELNVFFSIPIPLVVLTTALRLFVRLAITPKGRLAIDDYLMLCATVGVAIYLADPKHRLTRPSRSMDIWTESLCKGPPYGYGRHMEAVSSADYNTFEMGNYIFSHCYDVAIATTKLSVLALYHRIFVIPFFRPLVILTSAFVVVWLFTMEVILLVGWHPISSWWTGEGIDPIHLTRFAYYTNITNMVADLWIFAMPIPVLLKLQTGLNKRIGLCFLFSFGLGTCAISAVRLRWVFSMASQDVTWEEVPLGILSAWEACMGVLCGNLPVVYKALKSFCARLVSVPRGHSQDQIALQHRGGSKNSPDESHDGERRAGEWVRLREGFRTWSMWKIPSLDYHQLALILTQLPQYHIGLTKDEIHMANWISTLGLNLGRI